MAFENLTSVIDTLSENKLKIDKAYILKFGCVRLSPYENPKDNARFPITEIENLLERNTDIDDINNDEYYEAIETALKKCPNAFNLTKSVNTDPAIGFGFSSHNSVLCSGATFTLRIDLPERMQQFRTDLHPSEKPIEQFNVLSTGSLFATYASIEDFPQWALIGHEYRELLRKLISTETRFKAPLFGPSPIHPNFYIAACSIINDPKRRPWGVYEQKDDIFIVVDKNFDIAKLVKIIYDSISDHLNDFYFLKIQENQLLSYYVEIHHLFDDLANSISAIHSFPWYYLLQQNQCELNARKHLLKLHRRLVEVETQIFEYNKSQNDFLEDIKENQIFGRINGYFKKESEIDFQLPKSMLAAINHCESELKSFGNTRSVIIASLIGALVGAILTTLLK